MNKLFLVLLTAVALLITPYLHADEGDGGLIGNMALLKKLLQSSSDDVKQLLQSVNGEYVNYCGQSNWEKAGWKSEKKCLQDGRIHLVYYNNGRVPGLYKKRGNEDIQFSEEDKKSLLNALRDGAMLYMNDGSVLRECYAVGISFSKAICSTLGVADPFSTGQGFGLHIHPTLSYLRVNSDGELVAFSKNFTRGGQGSPTINGTEGDNRRFTWLVRY